MQKKNNHNELEDEDETFKAAEFFKLLESTFMSDLIHETRIRVQVRHARRVDVQGVERR